MSGFIYILLFMALVSPVLSAFLLRHLRTRLTAVPFYASANREPCDMRVWLPSDPR